MKKAVCAAVAAVLAVSMLTACVGGGNGNELSVEEPDMWTTQTQPEEVTSPKQMESETQLRNGLAATGNAPEEKLAFYEELLARGGAYAKLFEVQSSWYKDKKEGQAHEEN